MFYHFLPFTGDFLLGTKPGIEIYFSFIVSLKMYLIEALCAATLLFYLSTGMLSSARYSKLFLISLNCIFKPCETASIAVPVSLSLTLTLCQ